jgi:hypothetical protein
MSDKVLGWLWLPAHAKIRVGQTLTAEGPLELWGNGLHASQRALDALQYAEGTTICRVELSGEILEGQDRLCAQHCKVLAIADATTVLHEFVCWCAEQDLLREREAGREPNERSWAAVETKHKWLKGEATGEELAATTDADWDASSNTIWATPRGIAWDAWYATWIAAGVVTKATATARTTTSVAATDATWTAVWNAIWATQNAKLEEMLSDLLEEGAHQVFTEVEQRARSRNLPRSHTDD